MGIIDQIQQRSNEERPVTVRDYLQSPPRPTVRKRALPAFKHARTLDDVLGAPATSFASESLAQEFRSPFFFHSDVCDEDDTHVSPRARRLAERLQAADSHRRTAQGASATGYHAHSPQAPAPRAPQASAGQDARSSAPAPRAPASAGVVVETVGSAASGAA
ncbi:hypothetical protein KFE25_008278 [Diacronema lutheri]|uniref:Uncharacterized protein n=1 Tax=Diacronema lutheri TaxID=2081491 RepID=A0A8J6CBU3_DIALT|nr:hypothetical protein KFE25_008278 [Diacronema lutheri]